MRPSSSRRSEKASSISVVAESSMLKAGASASGKSSGAAGMGSSGKSVPLGKRSSRKRCMWNAHGELIAPAARSRVRAPRPVSLTASATALYSAPFLSGLNSTL